MATHFNEESFSKLLDTSQLRTDNFSIGDTVNGTIILITNDNAFVDIHAKSEAIIDIKEFIDEEGKLTIQKGDHITAYIANITRGEIVLTSTIGKSVVSPQLLMTAYKNQLPVYGIVKSITSGGYHVSIGGINAFCPSSQIDIKVTDTHSYIDKGYYFEIIRYEHGSNVVVSRRTILEKIKSETINTLKSKLSLGDIVEATITAIRDTGLHVTFSSIDGFIPKSEISLSRRPHLEHFFEGQKVNAKIIELNWDMQKITLSIKQLLPDPWSNISQFSIGHIYNGVVTKIIKSGVFVELMEGLEGFIPISRLSYTKKIHNPHDVCNEGETIQVKIIDIDYDARKIVLERVSSEENPWLSIDSTATESIYLATIEEVTSKGVVVVLPNLLRAFVPKDQCAAHTDLLKAYTIGNTIKVTLITVNPDERKCIASEKKALEFEERQEYEKYLASQSTGRTSTLGQMLKQKFEELKKKQNTT